MELLLAIVIVVTGWLVFSIIRSSKGQEGYKRWKAGNYAGENPYAKEKKESVSSLKNIFGRKAVAFGSKRFDAGAVSWCTSLLGVKEDTLREVLDYVPRQYTQFYIKKRSGGVRIITAPQGQLRAMQQTIYQRVLLLANVHPAVTGFCPGKSVSDNARVHLGRKNVLKVDLHDFFPSIRSPKVRATYREMGYSRPIAKVLAELCCCNRCLPQGAPTSPALSNIIAYPMDKKMMALADEYGLVYTRYADDLTFSGDFLPKDKVLSRIDQVIREEGFTMNVKKTRFLPEHKRKIITGVSVSSGTKMTIPKTKKREIRKNVHYVLTKGLASHQEHIGSTDPVYLKRLLGNLCYWRSIEPDNRYVSDSITALKSLM